MRSISGIFSEESMCRFYNCDVVKMKVSTFCKLAHFRAEEKRILDSVMGPAVYDSRIRPAGINGTGEEVLQNRKYLETLTESGAAIERSIRS